MFREVILPLSLPGVMIGFIFIFVLVMGDFATVRLIGGSTVDSVGAEVNVYYNNVDLPTAAAGASLLVLAMMIGVVVLLKFAKIRDSVSVVACWNSMLADRASTALTNSIRAPSPVRLTIRPPRRSSTGCNRSARTMPDTLTIVVPNAMLRAALAIGPSTAMSLP